MENEQVPRIGLVLFKSGVRFIVLINPFYFYLEAKVKARKTTQRSKEHKKLELRHYCFSNHVKNFSIETDWITTGMLECKISQISEYLKKNTPSLLIKTEILFKRAG